MSPDVPMAEQTSAKLETMLGRIVSYRKKVNEW